MTGDLDSILDDLLTRWHAYSLAWRPNVGYPSVAAGMGMYRPSRQYDDGNGALDDEIERQIVAAVDAQIAQLAGLMRVAIGVEARRLHGDGLVWGSAAWLPQSAGARDALIVEARGALMRRLSDAGVM